MTGEEEGDDDGDVATDYVTEPNNLGSPIYGSRRFNFNYCVTPNM